jgi:hypothetical protein
MSDISQFIPFSFNIAIPAAEQTSLCSCNGEFHFVKAKLNRIVLLILCRNIDIV